MQFFFLQKIHWINKCSFFFLQKILIEVPYEKFYSWVLSLCTKFQRHKLGSSRVQFFPSVCVCVCVCVFVCERDTRRGREAGRLEAWETVCFGLLMYAFMVEFYWRRQNDHVEKIITLVLPLPILWTWISHLGVLIWNLVSSSIEGSMD